MKVKPWAIGIMLLCTLLTSSAQLLLKSGALKLEFNILSVLSNWNIFLGIGLYGLGAVLVIFALRGGEVTVLYPIVTSSYIWVALGSSYFFGENVNSLRWIGILLVVVGILVITIGGNAVAEDSAKVI